MAFTAGCNNYRATPLIIRSSFTAEHPHSYKILYIRTKILAGIPTLEG